MINNYLEANAVAICNSCQRSQPACFCEFGDFASRAEYIISSIHYEGIKKECLDAIRRCQVYKSDKKDNFIDEKIRCINRAFYDHMFLVCCINLVSIVIAATVVVACVEWPCSVPALILCMVFFPLIFFACSYYEESYFLGKLNAISNEYAQLPEISSGIVFGEVCEIGILVDGKTDSSMPVATLVR